MQQTYLMPYPAYKDSGVTWLGDVPEHWKLQRMKRLFTERSEKGFPNEPLLAATQTKGVVRKEVYENRTVLALKDLHLLKQVRVGDFVISLRSFQGGIEIAHEQGIISPAYTILAPQKLADPRFFSYLLKTKPFVNDLTLYVTGIRQGQNIDYQKLSRSFLPLPPLPEQHAIARFLDHIDRRANRLIRAKRRLIALLNEQKQAIIHQAVTRGLDPDVPLRPSGVEWLGDVPAHWEVMRIKYLLNEVDVRSTTGEETLLSLRLNHGIVPHHEHFARPGQAPTLIGYKIIRPGQVVMNRLQANNGLIFTSEIHGAVSPDYAVFDAIGDVDLHYLTALFRTPLMKHKFRIESKGLGTGTAGFLRLYTDRFGMIPVALPPREEQTRIMQGLEAEFTELHTVISRVEREIDLIREYRTRLIADVVTGKLDVRAAAAALPEEVEAIEPEAGQDSEPDDETGEWEEETDAP